MNFHADRFITAPSSFEESLSLLTAGVGALERMETLSPDQLTRVRQAVIRLSNFERRMNREIG